MQTDVSWSSCGAGTGCWRWRSRSSNAPAPISPGECPPKMMFRLVAELVAEVFPVTVACRVLQVSRAGFYEWRSRQPRRRKLAIEADDLWAWSSWENIALMFMDARGEPRSPLPFSLEHCTPCPARSESRCRCWRRREGWHRGRNASKGSTWHRRRRLTGVWRCGRRTVRQRHG